MRTLSDIDHTFTYHAPTITQIAEHERIRDAAKAFAYEIFTTCPETPERTLALRDVQRAVMMANASIALHPMPHSHNHGQAHENRVSEQRDGGPGQNSSGGMTYGPDGKPA